MGLKSIIEWVADLITPIRATPELDVWANRDHLRSGDPRRIRLALGFLPKLGGHARAARPELEDLLKHEDAEIAAQARDVLAGLVKPR